jgi:putative chitinase
MHFSRNVICFLVLAGPGAGDPPLAQTSCSCHEPVENSTALVDNNRIAKFAPYASAELIAAVLNQWATASAAEINTPLRVQHFFAQIATETGGLRRIEEDLNYSAERLEIVFPMRVNNSEVAERLAHRPQETANYVYGAPRLGNILPDDGWRYRGSGFIQLTGRANFAARGLQIKLPLEAQPDLARKPRPGFTCAVAYWTVRAINVAADNDDLSDVRQRVNGGTTGLNDARIWLARAKRAFKMVAPAPEEADQPDAQELAAVKDKLKELGFLTKGPEESLSEDEFVEALKRFQASRGLPATGFYDVPTLYELTDPSLNAPK